MSKDQSKIVAAAARRRRNLTVMLATTLTSPFAAAPAFAQAGGNDSYGNDIIVTAQRREEMLEDVPMTVSVLSQESMNAAGINSVRDLSKVVTGVQIGQGGAFPAPAVRGVTTLTNGTSTENNVAVYIDGFYEPAAQAINIDLPNVSDVQILKGPQGTLYGRNATGGAILLNTINPGDEWQGKIELTYARFDDRRAAGYVAGPLSDKIGVSLSGYIRRSDGYHKLIDPVVPGKTIGNATPLEQDSIRAKLKFDLSENFTATLGYNFTRISDPRGNMFSVLENVPGQPVGSPIRPTELGTAAYNYPPKIESKQHQGTLKLELDTGIGMLRSYTSYAHFVPLTTFDFDGTYRDTAFSGSRYYQKTWQETVDFQVNAIQDLDLILGFMYYKDDVTPSDELPNSNYGPGLTLTQESFAEQHTDAWAGYIDATWHISDRIALNAGGRYTKESKDVSAVTYRYTAGPNNPPVVGFPFTERSVSFSRFTPRASIRYELAPRTNVYASYSKGFRSGYFAFSLPPTPAQWQPVKPEEVDAFEIGFKTAGSNYRFELSAFYYDYRNLHVSMTLRDPTCGDDPACARVLSAFGNAPKSKIKGIEGNFEYSPLENLTLRGSATWLHARYGNFPNATGVGVDPTLVGTNASGDPLKTFLNVGQTQDWSGLRMARAPDFTANFGAEYRIPDGDGGLSLSAHVNYTSRYVVTNPSVWGPLLLGTPYAEFARKQRFTEGAYALLSAQVTWTHHDGHFYVQAFGNNLTNHRYRLHYTGTATTVTNGVPGTNGGTYMPMAEPRVYGARVGYKF